MREDLKVETRVQIPLGLRAREERAGPGGREHPGSYHPDPDRRDLTESGSGDCSLLHHKLLIVDSGQHADGQREERS